MKTNHPHYEEHFDKVAERREESKVVLNEAIEQQGHGAITEGAL
jgi:penicillin V acylase-like amidase (Ntn superfamily)